MLALAPFASRHGLARLGGLPFLSGSSHPSKYSPPQYCSFAFLSFDVDTYAFSSVKFLLVADQIYVLLVVFHTYPFFPINYIVIFLSPLFLHL